MVTGCLVHALFMHRDVPGSMSVLSQMFRERVMRSTEPSAIEAVGALTALALGLIPGGLMQLGGTIVASRRTRRTSPWSRLHAVRVCSLGCSATASLPLGVRQRRYAVSGLVDQRAGHSTTLPWHGGLWACVLHGRGAARGSGRPLAQHPVDVWLDTPERLASAVANPGTWYGQVVGLVGTFQASLAAETALFVVGHAQWMVMRPVPAGRFTHPGERALIAGHLQGTAAVPFPLSGPTGVPELYVHAVEPTPLWYRQTVEYDAQGNATEETSHNFDWDDWCRVTRQPIYDAQGQIRERLTGQHDATGALGRQTWT